MAAAAAPDFAAPDFTHLADQLPLIVWTSEAGKGNDFLNRYWYTYTGLTVEESTGSRRWARALHPDDQERTFAEWSRVRETSEPFEIEYRLRRHDGQYRWFLSRAHALRDADGRISRWFGTCTDIHEQRQRDLHLRRLLGSPVIGVLFFDLASTRLPAANDRYLEIIGRTRAELEAGQLDWAAITPPEYYAKDAAAVAELRATGTHQAYEKEYLRPDGTRVSVLLAGSLTEDQQGVSICIDLTQLKRTETALREREQQLDTLANNIPQLAWMADPTGHIFWYNQRWYAYSGTTFAEMEGWGWEKIHHPDHVEHVVETWSAALKAGTPWEDTFPLRGADGQYRWFLSRAEPIRGADGQIQRWFGTNTDITQQRLLQDQLRSAYADLETKVTFRTLELEREVQRLKGT